jgi:catechol 2,3-dioxygenase-like lactoylglutathione lyase family enzyme
MPVTIDHVAIPCRDIAASARFLAEMLGLEVEPEGAEGEFFCIPLGAGARLLFQPAEQPAPQHIAFHVGDGEFAEVVRRLRGRGLAFGNDPDAPDNFETGDPLGGRGRVYFSDPSGHLFEVCC